jgi:hypothetical protein
MLWSPNGQEGKDWAVAATPALGQMREKGREEFLAARKADKIVGLKRARVYGTI